MRAEASILGVQRSRDRFGGRDREDFPPIARWRCNLTGLSQRQNLLFMAFTGQIFVYEPHFPSQALPSEPALVIETTPSRPGLAATLDPRNPRAINYLVIQDLGLEEILAVARDDGDVEAYLVAHVVNAVERCAAGEVAEVRPFFQSNVGLSAWGLAVHSNARIIAASSNTHNVTIFKFGLVDEDGEGSGESTRRRDVTETIINGSTNIPCICFCNTGDDPEGRWLLTTDIVGDSRTIDLRNMQVVQAFTFAVSVSGRRWHNPVHAGWAVMFLDKRSFVDAETLKVALGNNSKCERHERQHESPDHNRVGEMWDISESVMNPRKFTNHQTGHGNDNTSETGSGSDGEYLFDDDYDSPVFSKYMGIRFEFPTKADEHANLCGDLPCPILHTSVESVYLLQPADGPMIGFTDALRQSVQTSHAGLNMFERLNMTAYIPSIGVLILASQKGRAVIVSLNKLVYDSKTTYAMRIDCILPFARQERRNERPFMPLMGIAVSPVQGTELRRQSQKRERRSTEHLRDDRQRWRLLMIYCDHTILSYEIKRPTSEGPSTSVGSVVV